jgi:hypothetical protein
MRTITVLDVIACESAAGTGFLVAIIARCGILDGKPIPDEFVHWPMQKATPLLKQAVIWLGEDLNGKV